MSTAIFLFAIFVCVTGVVAKKKPIKLEAVETAPKSNFWNNLYYKFVPPPHTDTNSRQKQKTQQVMARLDDEPTPFTVSKYRSDILRDGSSTMFP